MKKILRISILFCFLIIGKTVSAKMVLEYDIININTQIALQLEGTVNVTVDWGDGKIESFTNSGKKSHTYTTLGTKTVSINGILGVYFNYSTNTSNARLTKVLSWDGLGITDFSGAFSNAPNLIQVPSTLPNTVTNLNNLFNGAILFNQDLKDWNTSNVTNMSAMFGGAILFNQKIGNWNTGNVINMSNMFNGATSFNQPIGNWNTEKVTDMSNMFKEAASFNQPIGNWNISKVFNISSMFEGTTSFNQPIIDWNTSNIYYINNMFHGASSFNQDIGSWNIEKIDVFETNREPEPYTRKFITGTLCSEFYDSILSKWSKENVKSNIHITFGQSKFTQAGKVGRDILVSKGWVIIDGGLYEGGNNSCDKTVNVEEIIVTPTKKLLKTINLQGQEISVETKGIQINIFSDGTREKVFLQ